MDETLTTNNIDSISHVKFNAVDRDYLVPTVEVKTSHDLTATRMTGTGSYKSASTYDAIASAFTVENPIYTSAINQLTEDHLAFGTFNKPNETKLGTIHDIASQPGRVINSPAISKTRKFFGSNKLLLVSAPMSNYNGLDTSNRTKTYVAPISMFLSEGLNTTCSVNNRDYMFKLSGIITNRVRAEKEDLKYTNNLLEDTLLHSIEFDDYTGELYTNDVIFPSIYEKPFTFVNNDPMLLQVGENSYSSNGKTLADVS